MYVEIEYYSIVVTAIPTTIPTQVIYVQYICTLDILFLSNHNIHKSSCGLCFWASYPLSEGDY